MFGGDLQDGIEAELIELHRARLRSAIVSLVDGDDHRAIGGARRFGNLPVAGHQALSPVHHQHQQVGRPNRQPASFEHERVEGIEAGSEHAARVGQLEVHALPLEQALVMRSLVVPGTGVTMARRLRVSRLKSVDFPTLGRPTSTTAGGGLGIFHGRLTSVSHTTL